MRGTNLQNLAHRFKLDELFSEAHKRFGNVPVSWMFKEFTNLRPINSGFNCVCMDSPGLKDKEVGWEAWFQKSKLEICRIALERPWLNGSWIGCLVTLVFLVHKYGYKWVEFKRDKFNLNLIYENISICIESVWYLDLIYLQTRRLIHL
jgi:hypothetical protein